MRYREFFETRPALIWDSRSEERIGKSYLVNAIDDMAEGLEHEMHGQAFNNTCELETNLSTYVSENDKDGGPLVYSSTAQCLTGGGRNRHHKKWL